jgi:hypothetical protein
VVQDDPHCFERNDLFGIDFEKWLKYRFSYADEPGSQIDAIWWDIGFGGNQAIYKSQLLPPAQIPGLDVWQSQGIDFIDGLVGACRKRNLEVFWNHRVNEIDSTPDGSTLEMARRDPVKAAHPDWTIKSWWWQGLWNLANTEARNYRVAILRELASSYGFDGIQLDFSRHVPCLPVGHQWDLRDCVTEYVRQVRVTLLELEKKRGKPYLLAARIPALAEGCRIDGFDIATWARENLVDIFSLGDRSIDVDIPRYRQIVQGTNIKLQPCLDDHHSTDGYRFPPVEFFRGVYWNWWRQGADSVMTFNWSCAAPDTARLVGAKPGPISHQQAYRCIGSTGTLTKQDKLFVVQRKGGYPWAEGFFNRNDFAELPAGLHNSGDPCRLHLCISDDHAYADVLRLNLSVILTGFRRGDDIRLVLNGSPLATSNVDLTWNDPQIFTSCAQPISGSEHYSHAESSQFLTRLEFRPLPSHLQNGRNLIEISIASRIPFDPVDQIQVEKVELNVGY